MNLTPGTRIGPYQVVSIVGAGGMGEVYRARDARLNRDVALKVLPELFANDPDRLARYTREAQVLASLNHPKIAAIYGFEESNGLHALVLELVIECAAGRVQDGAFIQCGSCFGDTFWAASLNGRHERQPGERRKRRAARRG